MGKYKCFDCGKELNEDSVMRRVRCPYCGGRMVFKERATTTKVKAR
jgi:DNA-directed RNA polymerase subunit RPC12/RpoP